MQSAVYTPLIGMYGKFKDRKYPVSKSQRRQLTGELFCIPYNIYITTGY